MGNKWQQQFGPSSIAAQASNQAGLNTQAQQAALFPAILVLTATAEVVLPHPQNPAAAFVLNLQPVSGLEQIPFNIVASGVIKTLTTGTITLKLYSGTSLTPGSDVALASSGAITQNTANAPFLMLAFGIYDSISGKLTGYTKFLVNNTLVAEAAFSTVVTGVADTNNPVASFVLSATASAAAPGTPTTVQVQSFTAG